MMSPVIVDTGPLVALVDKQDKYHSWVLTQLKAIAPPLLTCEAVIVEACFLIHKKDPASVSRIFLALNNQFLHLPFVLSQEYLTVNELRQKYIDVPMSVADACLVRMSELFDTAKVFTLDRDFEIYRKNRNQVIPCIIPTKNNPGR